MTKYIIKLAFRTIPRMGLVTILFLFLGIYLIFPTARLYADMKQGNAVPCKFLASTESAFDEAALWDLPGVRAITPILHFNATLSTGKASCTLTVEAVRSSSMNAVQISGSVFSEEGNMPVLVLNTSAIKAFRDEAGRKTDSLDLDGSFVLSADRELPAKVCGVCEDEKSEPMAYMSYSTAHALLGASVQHGVTMRFTLDNAGSEPSVVSKLQELGFAAEVDETRAIQWSALQEQLKSFVLLCIGILISSAVLLCQRLKMEMVQYEMSYQTLELCGISRREIIGIMVFMIVILLLFGSALCLFSFLLSSQRI